MNKPIPDEPQFIKTLTSLQKWLAGVAVSMFFVVWVTGWDVVVNIFKPDFVKPLTYVRMSLALFGIGITGLVGFPQIIKILNWLVDSWEMYKKISEFKDKK